MHTTPSKSSFKITEFHNFNDRLRSTEVRKNKTVRSKLHSDPSSHNRLLPKHFELRMRYLKTTNTLKGVTQIRRAKFSLTLDSRPCHALKSLSALVLRRCNDLNLNLFFHSLNPNLMALRRVCRLSKNVKSTRILSKREHCPKTMAFVFQYLPACSEKFQIQLVRPYSTCLLKKPATRKTSISSTHNLFEVSQEMKYILNFAPPFDTIKITSLSAYRLRNLSSICITPSFSDQEEKEMYQERFWRILGSIATLETLCLEIHDSSGDFGNFDTLRACLARLTNLRMLKLNFGNKTFEWYRFMKNFHQLTHLIESQNVKIDVRIELPDDFSQNCFEYSEGIFAFMPEPSEIKFKLEFTLKEELNVFDPIEYVCFSVRNETNGIKTTSVYAYTKNCSEFHHKTLSFGGSRVSYLRLEERYQTHLFHTFSGCLAQYAGNLTRLTKIGVNINLSEAKFQANNQTAFKQLMQTVSLLKNLETIEFFFLDEFLPEFVFPIDSGETPLKVIESALMCLKKVREITLSFGGYQQLGLAHVENMFLKSDGLKTVTISLRNFKKLSSKELEYIKSKIDLKLDTKAASLQVVTIDNQKVSASAELTKLDYRPIKLIFHPTKSLEIKQ